MGYDARCTLTLEGRSARGTARLEHKDLVFKGPARLAVPLSEITSATAVGGTLRVTFAGRTADFEIGESAGKWARRITNPPSRLDKLGVKAGLTVAIVGAVGEDECPAFVAEIEARGARISRRGSGPPPDLIFLAAPNRTALERLPALRSAMASDGALWVVRPKGTDRITEAETMAAGKRAGLVDVKVVSFSERHTAEKFVIPVKSRDIPTVRGRKNRRVGNPVTPVRRPS